MAGVKLVFLQKMRLYWILEECRLSSPSWSGNAFQAVILCGVAAFLFSLWVPTRVMLFPSHSLQSSGLWSFCRRWGQKLRSSSWIFVTENLPEASKEKEKRGRSARKSVRSMVCFSSVETEFLPVKTEYHIYFPDNRDPSFRQEFKKKKPDRMLSRSGFSCFRAISFIYDDNPDSISSRAFRHFW